MPVMLEMVQFGFYHEGKQHLVNILLKNTRVDYILLSSARHLFWGFFNVYFIYNVGEFG